jgi:hypothetical protein
MAFGGLLVSCVTVSKQTPVYTFTRSYSAHEECHYENEEKLAYICNKQESVTETMPEPKNEYEIMAPKGDLES